MTADTGLTSRVLAVDIFGSEVRLWLIALGLSMAFFLSLVLLKLVVIRRLKPLAKRTATRADDLVIYTLGQTKLSLLLVFSLALGARSLRMPLGAKNFLLAMMLLLGALQLGLWLTTMLNRWFELRVEDATDDDPGRLNRTAASNVLRFTVKLVIWVVLLLAVLDTVGVDITSLVTGLGIGGVAMALAVQGVIKDFVCSVVIALDKPFKVGDFVVLGDLMGTIDNVGIKTTRLKGLQGERIVMPNSDMVGSRLQNLSTIDSRRIAFTFGVRHDTAVAHLEALPGVVEDLVGRHEGVRFEWARFAKIDESAHVFDVLAVVESGDWYNFLAVREAFQLDLLRALEERGVTLAQPARAVHLTGDR